MVTDKSKRYNLSANLNINEQVANNVMALLCLDAFLAKLLSSVGISDAAVGIITSFSCLSSVFDIMGMFFNNRIRNVKTTVIVSNLLGDVMRILIYLVPFTPFSIEVKTILFMTVFLLSSFFRIGVFSIWYKWTMSFVSDDNRGRYCAKKDAIVTGLSCILIPITAYFFDYYERIGNIEQAFIITSIAMTIFSLVRSISFLKMKRIDKNNDNTADFREIFANTIGKRDCRKVILLQILWNISKFTCYGFLGVYKMNDLMFSVSLIQIINIAASIIRVLCSRLMGKYTDKHTYAKGFRLGLIILSVGYVSLCFCTPKTRWLIIVYSVLEAIALSGIEANNLNVVYDYTDSKYFVEASAIKNSIGGVVGFLITIPAGKLLDYVQESGNTFLGFHLYGQQILAAAGLLMTVITILYITYFMKKERKLYE